MGRLRALDVIASRGPGDVPVLHCVDNAVVALIPEVSKYSAEPRLPIGAHHQRGSLARWQQPLPSLAKCRHRESLCAKAKLHRHCIQRGLIPADFTIFWYLSISLRTSAAN
jgi:hypothetical protein